MSQQYRPAPGKRDYFSGGLIAALATGPGGAIDIVRVSGSGCDALFSALTGLNPSDCKPREMTRAQLRAQNGSILDEALAVRFQNPASYTGEDLFELHLHGGGYIARRVLEELASLGARQALPGEFTFRAVKNGKLSVPAAQAVADLIAASNDAALGLAIDKLADIQIQSLAELSKSLKNLAVLSELGIDFSDQDLEETSIQTLLSKLAPLRATLAQLEGSFSRGVRLQNGIETAFLGLPNAGKSSFFNVLLGEARSIVSSTPGTTRDVVRERLTLRSDHRSVTLLLSDTAGLRSTGDAIEAEGVARSRQALAKAELVFWVVDATGDLDETIESYRHLDTRGKTVIGVLSKVDLVPMNRRLELNNQARKNLGIADWCEISSVTGEGIESAIALVLSKTSQSIQRVPGEVVLTRLDQLDSVRAARAHLDRAAGNAEMGAGHELLASDLRQALDALGPLIGETPPDEILGKIFSEFCIGK